MKKIVVIATVKNECDIIELYCRYSLSFCDCLVIYENHKSSDNTREIIQKLIDEGLPIFFEAEESDEYYELVKALLVDIAVNKYEADLVIQLDADEFLIHKDGINPREVLEHLEEDVEYQIPWRTYICPPGNNSDTEFMTSKFSCYRNPAFEEVMGYAGKTLASRYLLTEKQAKFVFGSHWLIYPDDSETPVRVETSNELICAHYPIRSSKQVMRKVVPNYINKWTMPESVRLLREHQARCQMGSLFGVLLENGCIPFEKMRELSITYSIDCVDKKEQLDELFQKLGENLILEEAIDFSFCADRLNLKYTDSSDNNDVLLQATLKSIDAALQHLDIESREKTIQIIRLKQQYKDEINELTRHRDELEQQCLDERERFAKQIEEMHQSITWRIGAKIVRIGKMLTFWKR